MVDFILSLLPLEILTKGGITIGDEFVNLTPQMQTFLCTACICVFFVCCGVVISMFNICTDMFRKV